MTTTGRLADEWWKSVVAVAAAAAGPWPMLPLGAWIGPGPVVSQRQSSMSWSANNNGNDL